MPSKTDDILYHFQSSVNESAFFSLMFPCKESFALPAACIFCVPRVLAV